MLRIVRILSAAVAVSAVLMVSAATAQGVRIDAPGVRVVVPYLFSYEQCRGCEYGRYNGRVGWHRGHNKHRFHPMQYHGRYGYTNRHDYEHGRR